MFQGALLSLNDQIKDTDPQRHVYVDLENHIR